LEIIPPAAGIILFLKFSIYRVYCNFPCKSVKGIVYSVLMIQVKILSLPHTLGLVWMFMYLA